MVVNTFIKNCSIATLYLKTLEIFPEYQNLRLKLLKKPTLLTKELEHSRFKAQKGIVSLEDLSRIKNVRDLFNNARTRFKDLKLYQPNIFKEVGILTLKSTICF